MQIYVGHSKKIDYKNELYKPIRESQLNSEHTFVLPHEHSTEPYNSKEFLDSCHLFIAEVSCNSMGLGIELGWANAKGVPTVCVHKKGSTPSTSLNIIARPSLEYEDTGDLMDTIRKAVKYYYGIYNECTRGQSNNL
jgi:hypothetical protein